MWNLVFLQLLLEENGCAVTNLGPCTPIELVRRTALAEMPDLIVVSSVNGHGHLDGLVLVTELRKHLDLAATRIVIGGKLGISGEANLDHASALVEAGFDAVFEASSSPKAVDDLVALATRPAFALAGGER